MKKDESNDCYIFNIEISLPTKNIVRDSRSIDFGCHYFCDACTTDVKRNMKKRDIGWEKLLKKIRELNYSFGNENGINYTDPSML